MLFSAKVSRWCHHGSAFRNFFILFSAKVKSLLATTTGCFGTFFMLFSGGEGNEKITVIFPVEG
jgi:hypothetical protein